MWSLFWTIQTLLRALWLMPGKDVYFNVIILTLFVYIFTEYLYLLFGYVFILINSKKRIFSTDCGVLGSDNKDLCFPSRCIVTTYCSESEIRHVLAPKLLSPCYKRIGSWFELCVYRVMGSWEALGKFGEHSRS